MSSDKISSGIDELDELIEGGFRKGSLIIVAGNSGTGKTVFGSAFLCEGVQKGDAGIYVSFAEDRETYIHNMSKHLGQDCRACIEGGSMRFLDLTTVKEGGISAVLKLILEEVEKAKAKRLVIDSFTAMAQAFKERIDARIILHMILGRIMRQSGCTTLLIVEVPTGEEHIGIGIEEFMADAVFILKKGEYESRETREVEIAKMRGTKIPQSRFFFTLEGGIHVFPPFEDKSVKGKRFQPIPDSETHFSTGSKALDKILGGYPKGGVVLLEQDHTITPSQSRLIIFPTSANFIVKDRAHIIIPSLGINIENSIRGYNVSYGISEGDIRRFWRVFEPTTSDSRPHIFTYLKGNADSDFEEIEKVEKELKEQTKQPIKISVGVDTLEALYGRIPLKEISMLVARVRNEGDSMLIRINSSMSKEFIETFSSFSDVHIKLVREHGTILFYGVKPRTGLYVLETDVSKGYPLPKLTPIV